MNKIITISREFESGGREIGKRLSDELGFAYYDRDYRLNCRRNWNVRRIYIKYF